MTQLSGKCLTYFGVALLAAVATHSRLQAQQPLEVSRKVSETLTVHADLYRASSPATAPVILLFHQGGGDARNEYAEIIPRLVTAGYHVLSADIRGGGTR